MTRYDGNAGVDGGNEGASAVGGGGATGAAAAAGRGDGRWRGGGGGGVSDEAYDNGFKPFASNQFAKSNLQKVPKIFFCCLQSQKLTAKAQTQ